MIAEVLSYFLGAHWRVSLLQTKQWQIVPSLVKHPVNEYACVRHPVEDKVVPYPGDTIFAYMF